MINRLFVEKKDGYNISAKKLADDIKNVLNLTATDVREILRYDVEGLTKDEFETAKKTIFSEPSVDNVYETTINLTGYSVFVIEFLPGQFDQRADSAVQCIQFLTLKPKVLVKYARVIAIKGVDKIGLEKIKNYLINPVESREGSFDIPKTLVEKAQVGGDVEIINGFIKFDENKVKQYHYDNGFAMSIDDLLSVQNYYKSENRDPFITELKVIDTYWSDHCRHTTFLTELTDIKIESKNPHIKKAYSLYEDLFNEFYKNRPEKYKCMMDIATIAVKKLRKEGKLQNLDISDEINACSVEVTVDNNGKPEQWLIMFKNETHNHPTEIEPFGGAGTCLGGAIRDPLSGRTYAYQAMRVTGSGDPREKFEDTLEGKLPQRVITTVAASGFSAYGNQIGLASGLVAEMYHPNYKAKRLEAGYIIAGALKENVVREKPKANDIIILLGGDTGRDGCGGATGSSKAHTSDSAEKSGAEVQKGNPLIERKIQRLFRNPEVSKMIIKCNDFGAGGVSVAIGELADGVLIDLDKVPTKYDGLDGTELAISESQERMAVVIKPENVEKFKQIASDENLNASVVAYVTDNARMQMMYKGNIIVDISRDFLNTNGVKQTAVALIEESSANYYGNVDKTTKMLLDKGHNREALLNELTRLNVCSKKGLTEMFDSTIGAGTILLPLGGRYQLTPEIAMASKPPVANETDTATISAFGCNPYLMESDAFLGAIYSVVISLSKLVTTGAKYDTITLSFQEFFKRLGAEPARWGEPVQALLGALYTQINLGVGAIGGKDSMSGSFNDLDVPPTLISFGMGIGKASTVLTNTFLNKGKLIWLPIKRDEYNVPDFAYLKKLYEKINYETENNNILHASVVEEGGVATEAIKCCLGDGKGVEFYDFSDEYLKAYFGDIIIVTKNEKLFDGFDYNVIGRVSDTPKILFDDSVIKTEVAKNVFTDALDTIFPATVLTDGYTKNYGVSYTNKKASNIKVSKPCVFVPVFPGTNGEYDISKRFIKAGARVETLIIKNQTENEIIESIERLKKGISECQILALPGGSAGGNEPDGSGKFITTTFRHAKVADAIMELIYNRDGLILGIANGFQALIKLGLVPFGKILDQTAKSPTLTYNNIARHTSTIAQVRVASNKSPWFNNVKTGDIYATPISSGEGRFIAPKNILDALVANGQIATQYVDLNGNATMETPYNPNGSAYAVEGITSPDGRILGKMGHSERIGNNLYKNYPFEFDMKIFESGVKYFK